MAADNSRAMPPTRARQAIAKRLRAVTGEITTATIGEMEQRLAWFPALPAENRSWITLVAQAGIDGFVDWFLDPEAVSPRSGVFGSAPRALARRISLLQTVQLVRTTTDVVEREIQRLMPRGERANLQLAVVRYSSEVAFAAAEIYARAAEVRGAWDDRTESLVIDAVIRGELDEDLLSRAATLGWSADSPLVVVIGPAAEIDPALALDTLRRKARKLHHDALATMHGERFIVILGSPELGPDEPVLAQLTPLAEHFGPGPVVVGPVVDNLLAANTSARAALAGYRAAAGWRAAPRPVTASDLLPERALNGDGHARRGLATLVHDQLTIAGNDLLETLITFFDQGSSIEATARMLFVHANTVRYRLRRIHEVTGFSPTMARDSYALRLGITLGELRSGNQL